MILMVALENGPEPEPRPVCGRSLFFDDLTSSVVIGAGVPECPGRNALTFSQHAQQKVLGADGAVVQVPGLFLREDEDPAGAVREVLEHSTRVTEMGHVSSPDEAPGRQVGLAVGR